MLQTNQYRQVSKSLKTVSTLFELNVKLALKTPKRDLGKWVSTKLQDLGPTYIKIGQFMSSRKDIFGGEFVSELSKLRDKVNPMETHEFYQTINEHLDTSQFKFIDPVPLASASIGQVHKAKLLNGKDVIVKVKRPGIADMIKDDIKFIHNVLSILQMFRLENVEDSIDMINDFEKNVLNEVNFDLEMKHLQRYLEIYKSNEGVTIPRLYKKLSSQYVIVMEYVPSQNIYEYDGNRKNMSYRLMDVFISQLIMHGLVHGDPHAGNIGYDESKDSIVLYDFGNVIEIEDIERQRMKELIYQLVIGNKTAVMGLLTKLDMKILDKKLMSEYIDKYIDYLKTIDISQLKSSNGPSIKLPLKFSDKVFRLVRTYGIMEGICKDLNPKFNYFDLLFNYINELILDEQFLVYKASNDLTSVLDSLIPTTTEDKNFLSSQSMKQQPQQQPLDMMKILVFSNGMLLLFNAFEILCK